LHDEFIAAIEAEIGARDPQAMVGAIYDAQRPVSRLASLAPIVLEFAGKGERSATKIVQSAALDLFELVKTLVRNAGVADREFSLALSGGMLGSNSLLSYLLETRIAGDLPHVRPIKGAPAPQFGAARLARALLATA
jgi:N-acetylglucosamine kinase-like BadF-type ATPase